MIKVEFPDGQVRKMRSAKRIEGGREIEEPRSHPDWIFVRTFEGGWRARER